MLFNVLLYAIMIYLIFRMFSMNKGVNRRRQIISVVNKIFDEAEFFSAADELIQNAQDPVIETKTRIIRLWGMAFHNRTARFEDELNEINLDSLFTYKNGKVMIESDEDSFFYLLLAIPNMLYAIERTDLSVKIFEKVSAYDDKLENQLIKAVADHCMMYYKGEGDLGEQFFRNVDQGEYPGYRYSKQLIGIYKNVCDTMLCRILADRGEDYSEFEIYVQNFAKMGVGKRFIEALGLDIKAPEEEGNVIEEEEPEEPEEPEESEEPETVSVKPEEEALMIDVSKETAKEESEKEEEE